MQCTAIMLQLRQEGNTPHGFLKGSGLHGRRACGLRQQAQAGDAQLPALDHCRDRARRNYQEMQGGNLRLAR